MKKWKNTRPLIAEEQQAQLESLNDLVGALERLGVVEEMEEEEEDDEDGEESADEQQRLVRQAEEMFVI